MYFSLTYAAIGFIVTPNYPNSIQIYAHTTPSKITQYQTITLESCS
jgi:hypothetical protein